MTTKTNPPTDAEANTEGSGAKAWGADLTDAGKYTFTDPRKAAVGSEANADVQTTDKSAPTVAAKLKVKYKGEEREYDEVAAATMISQHLGLQETHKDFAPIINSTKELMQQTGITDRTVFLNTVKAGLAALAEKQAMDKNQTTQQPAAPAQAVDPAAARSIDVEAELNAMEQENGIKLTPGLRDMFRNLAQNSNAVAGVAQKLPELEKEVSSLSSKARAEALMARNTQVNTAAQALAKELGLEDEKDYPEFQSWMQEQDKVFPGYSRLAVASPEAISHAMRQFHGLRTGAKASADKTALEDTLKKNAARAGGDAVASRGGNGGTSDFNQTMMNSL